jgi:predicted flap endonuclease-1-like 5' DNA nuclease
MSTAAIVAGTIGAVGAIGGSAISASAAGKAASTQANAADYSANLQAQEAQNALNVQEQEWNQQQQNEAPWLNAGKAGLSNLQTLLGLGPNKSAPGYGSLNTPFTAPTIAQAQEYPGYQFGLQQGEGALQNTAAAKGNLLSGNSEEALNNYAQNYAQNDYSNVYNQAFNTFETNQTNQFNKLAALSGIGQTAATTLGAEGSQAAGNIAGVDLTAGAQQGADYQNAGAAEASGYVGAANAYSGALTGTSGNLMNLYLLSQLGGLGTQGGLLTSGGAVSPYGQSMFDAVSG